MLRVDLRASFEAEADKYFWLRDAADGSEVDKLRTDVASVFSGLPPHAFLMLDVAVAGEREGAPAVHRAIPGLPDEIGGIRVREALGALADALATAPPPPSERRAVAERALASLDVARVEDAICWVSDALGFTYAPDTSLTIETYVVASGVPLGGLTGLRIDDSPVCFVAVVGQDGSTFAEAIIHEATHVLDFACESDSSVVGRLRDRSDSSAQLWHVPYFIAAGEAARRFVDPAHRDFGDTHGYYAKVPREFTELEAEGIVAAIRNR